ncbi:MAG: hypothetical protein BWK80_14075, partial [Desulfobacteraceae bacterium IS3]
FTQPTHGKLSDNGDGSYTYTPDADFSGADSFIYTVSDGKGGENSATVVITVTHVVKNNSPVAGDDSFFTDEDSELTISVKNLLYNDLDKDGDALVIKSFTKPSHGNLVDNGGGTLTYISELNFNGSDKFIYTVSDSKGGNDAAVVNIVVYPVNDLPLVENDNAVTYQGASLLISPLLNDSDTDGDEISIVSFSQPDNGSVRDNGDGTLIYTPRYAFFGQRDIFTYIAADGKGGTDTGVVNITVIETTGAFNGIPVKLDYKKEAVIFSDERISDSQGFKKITSEFFSLEHRNDGERIHAAISHRPDQTDDFYGGGNEHEIIRYEAVETAKEAAMRENPADQVAAALGFSEQIQSAANNFEIERAALLKALGFSF